MDPITATAARRRRAWLAVAGWLVVIWGTVPFVRRLGDAYEAVADPRSIAVGVAALAVLGAGGAGAWLWRRRRRPPLAALLWLAGVAAVVAVWSWRLDAAPIEAMHFIQYGVLGVLANRALRLDHPDASAFLAAALIGLLAGTCDEILQWLVPERYWDLRDVALNGGAAALAQAALWPLWPPPHPRPRRRGLALACRLGAAWLALMTACMAATPARTDWLVARWPSMVELRLNPMAEYGYRFVAPQLGEMRTRLPPAALEAYDDAHAEEAAALLDRYPQARYGAFLAEISPAAHPFEYQARVHIASRDIHRQEAHRATDPATVRFHASVAFREEQILDRFYRRTIARSRFALPPAERRWLEEHRDPAAYVVSKSAAHILLVPETALRIALLAAAAALLGTAWWLRRTGTGATGGPT